MTEATAHQRTSTGLAGLAALGGGVLALAVARPLHVSPEALEQMRLGLKAWTVIPFALLLGCIAVFPLFWKAWENNRVKALVAAVLCLPVLAAMLAWNQAGVEELLTKGREYVSFLCLLAALFVISGGIFIKGSLDGTPALNTLLLGIGAVLASLIGTTGASMLLIRPLLRANAPREKKAHVVVFFIFIVANCGGLLTPLGDPPLFLGFLKGVPFEWTVKELWPLWLLMNGSLLFVFSILDKVVFEAEEAARPGSQRDEVKQHAPLRIDGAVNLLFLAGVVAVVFASGRGAFAGGEPWPFGVQEGAMLLLALASYGLTRQEVHDENHFSFGPIVEVAVLFAGIFTTMTPALILLNVHAAALGLARPAQYFWASGLLSSFLDNAPTYLTFAATGAGVFGIPTEGRYLAALLAIPGAQDILRAISAGAVLMGANTYIGNGPNFMVKAVAESRGVKMPSFFGYMAYSFAVLVPLFVLVTFLFFRPR